jgi:phage-related protein
MPSTFTFPASYGTSVTRTPRVKSVTFGDGYEQRQPDGINVFTDVWSMAFNNISPTDAMSIDTFLSGLGGTQYFLWTPPSGTEGKYICKEWSRTINTANSQSVTATFKRVFDL